MRSSLTLAVAVRLARFFLFFFVFFPFCCGKAELPLACPSRKWRTLRTASENRGAATCKQNHSYRLIVFFSFFFALTLKVFEKNNLKKKV